MGIICLGFALTDIHVLRLCYNLLGLCLPLEAEADVEFAALDVSVTDGCDIGVCGEGDVHTLPLVQHQPVIARRLILCGTGHELQHNHRMVSGMMWV